MVYILINEETKQAQKLIELIETLPFAKILREPNAVTKKAMADAKHNKTRKYKSCSYLITCLDKK